MSILNMNRSKGRAWGRVASGVAVAALFAGVALPTPGAVAQTDGFADPAFRQVWQRTDLPLQQGRVARSWIWGPAPGRSLREPFAESPGGTHLGQYFDKARMEINNPNQPASTPFHVTNGLLVVEMVSGRIQTGVNSFETVGASDQLIAGERGADAPTYAALQGVASVGLPGADRRAAPVAPGVVMPSQYIDRNGAVSRNHPSLVGAEALKSAGFVSETGHNIPDVFWSYLNAEGPVFVSNGYVNDRIVNWVTDFGYPVTEPFWTTIKVEGRDRLIMFQAFQRRILTYSPANPMGWKVEMGNVGAQYYTWRYETPNVTCQRVPVRGFGRVWADNRNVQRDLGCPLPYPPFDKEIVVKTAFQPFERGSMLYIERTTYTVERIIYVFFEDGTFQPFEDTWREGQPVSGGQTPPQGRFEPIRGFGKVWREGTGARVRERLGWATAPEKGADGAYQRFDRGEMYWSGTVDKIWVLFNSVAPAGGVPGATPVPGPGVPPLRYQVFDDNFN
ncbi:MAG: hypothetical protein M3437_08625 [Chloroflexota bacterium]|nr:hypothetical protein [Chloroflexota bacterium]